MKSRELVVSRKAAVLDCDCFEQAAELNVDEEWHPVACKPRCTELRPPLTIPDTVMTCQGLCRRRTDTRLPLCNAVSAPDSPRA
jgi:hypothetical protein